MSTAARAGTWLLLTTVSASALAGCGEREAAVPTAAGTEAAVGEAAGENGAASPDGPWFEEVTAALGIDFHHDSGVDGSFYFPEHVGSGGALFDYDLDGDLDLYLVNSGPHGAAAATAPRRTDRLYRQEADGRFVDRTAAAGVAAAGYGMGAALGDIDRDGDLDLLVTQLGRDVLFENRGDGTFADVTAAAGLDATSWSTAACFFDAEGDGDLDLFVVTYVDYDPPRACTDLTGRPEYCGPAAFRGVADLLYENRGDGTFDEIGAVAGIAGVASKGLGIACLDLDGDDRPDVYVANDGEKNELWSNRGDGRFEDRALLAGAAVNLLGKAEASMGVAAGDFDGDGRLDLFLAHLNRETNTLYRGLGDAAFEDVTPASGLGGPSLPYTAFGAAFADLDLDADLDLAVVNGRVRRGEPLIEGGPKGELDAYWRDYAEPNLVFENLGDGRFEDRSAVAGELASRAEVSRSLLSGDLDADGDLDLVVTNCNGPVRLYANRAPRRGRWAVVRVVDDGSGAEAAGARVVAEAGGRSQLRVLTSAGSYLAAGPLTAHFGLGEAAAVDRLGVRWPNGDRRRYLGLPAERTITLYRSR